MRGLVVLALVHAAFGCRGVETTRSEPALPPEVVDAPAASLDSPPVEASSPPPTASPGCADAGTPECPTYARYVNPHFAFSVDVPTFFVKKGADADGRGQPFEYGSKARIRAWAMYDSPPAPDRPPMTADALYGDWTRRENVTFKTLAKNTWVVRGTERGRLRPHDAPIPLDYYSRSILADGIITTIEIWYDPSLSDAFEPIVARLGASLMTIPGQGVRAKAHP
jgi:hypothetical protein